MTNREMINRHRMLQTRRNEFIRAIHSMNMAYVYPFINDHGTMDLVAFIHIIHEMQRFDSAAGGIISD